MRLIATKSSYNFYESFSDLLFCTLVLFIVLILTLALNVNKRVEALQQPVVKNDQQAAEEAAALKGEKVKLEAELAKLQSANQSLKGELQDARTNEIKLKQATQGKTTTEAKLAEASKELEKLTSANQRLLRLVSPDKIEDEETEHFQPNQFNGQVAAPAIHLAYRDPEADGLGVTCYPVPVEIITGYTTPVLGETALEEAARKKRYLHELAQVWREIAPLNSRQYNVLMDAFSICGQTASNEESDKGLGVLFDSDNTVTVVVPESPAMYAAVQPGHKLISLNNTPIKTDKDGESNISTIIHSLISSSQKCAPLVVQHEGRISTLSLPVYPYRAKSITSMSCAGISLFASGLLTEDGRELQPARTAPFLRLNSNSFFHLSMLNDGYLNRQKTVPRASFGRSELEFRIRGTQVLIGGESFSRAQFRTVLRALDGAVSIKFVPDENCSQIPQDFAREVLLPSGFINRSPYYKLNTETIGVAKEEKKPELFEHPDAKVAAAFLASPEPDKLQEGIGLVKPLLAPGNTLSINEQAELLRLKDAAEDRLACSYMKELFQSGHTDSLRTAVKGATGVESRKLAERYSRLMVTLKQGKDAEEKKEYAEALRCYQCFLEDQESRESYYARQVEPLVRRFASSGLSGALIAEGNELLAAKKLGLARLRYMEAAQNGANVEGKIKELENTGRRLFEAGCNFFREGAPGQARANFLEALACFTPTSTDYKRMMMWIKFNNFDIE